MFASICCTCMSTADTIQQLLAQARQPYYLRALTTARSTSRKLGLDGPRHTFAPKKLRQFCYYCSPSPQHSAVVSESLALSPRSPQQQQRQRRNWHVRQEATPGGHQHTTAGGRKLRKNAHVSAARRTRVVARRLSYAATDLPPAFYWVQPYCSWVRLLGSCGSASG